MYARMSTARVQRDKLGELVEVFSRSAAPTIRQQPGNCDVILLTNAETGDASVITLWETEADLAGYEAGIYGEIVAGRCRPARRYAQRTAI